MNKLWKLTRGMAATTLPVLLSFTGTPGGMAVAQESGEKLEEVIVIEAPIARRHFGWTTGGLPVEVIELKRRVNYADLDLTREADVTVFKKRVETAAKWSCEELADRYPVSFTDRLAITRCINEAVDRTEDQIQAATEQIQTAIASAH